MQPLFNFMEACHAFLAKAKHLQALLEQTNPYGSMEGETSLAALATNGHLTICRHFLAVAEDPQRLVQQTITHGRFEGCTALHFAAQRERTGTCELFLSVAKDPEALLHQAGCMYGSDLTAMHLVARHGNEDLCNLFLNIAEDIESLLLHKGNFTELDAMGYTALHTAAHSGHTAVVRKLLHVVADPKVLLEATDANGVTPAVLAKARGHVELTRFLETGGIEGSF